MVKFTGSVEVKPRLQTIVRLVCTLSYTVQRRQLMVTENYELSPLSIC